VLEEQNNKEKVIQGNGKIEEKNIE